MMTEIERLELLKSEMTTTCWLKSQMRLNLERAYGKQELANDIIKTIRKRENLLPIGTLTRIYSYCRKLANSQQSVQTHTHRLTKDVACGDSSRLSKQGSEKSLHPEADDFFCNNCKDECDCHLFVGGSGKACPDCEKPQQSVGDKK